MLITRLVLVFLVSNRSTCRDTKSKINVVSAFDGVNPVSIHKVAFQAGHMARKGNMGSQ
jgi:hypothetical protein